MDKNEIVTEEFSKWTNSFKYDNVDFYGYKNNFSVYEDIKSDLIFGDLNTAIPKYTIFIPTFKRPDLLQETLDSALNQNGFTDYEIIILDNDPERDSPTEKILKKKYSKYKHVFYYKQRKWNPANCTRGVELSRTEWFTILSDDDLLASEFLNSVDKILTEFPQIEGLACGYSYFEYDYLKKKKVLTSSGSWLDDLRQKFKMFLDKHLMVFQEIVGQYSFDDYYVRKAAFPEIGVVYKRKNIIELGAWDSSYVGGDLSFNVKYMSYYNLFYTTEILAKKRFGSGNCTSMLQRDLVIIMYLLFRTFENRLVHLEYDEDFLKSSVLGFLKTKDLAGVTFEDLNVSIKGEYLFKKEEFNDEFLEYGEKKRREYINILNERPNHIKTYTKSFFGGKNDFQNKLDKMAEKYKNKRVVIYGTGKISDYLFENYDLSKFDIVVVSDSRYVDESETYRGFNAVPPKKIAEYKPDIVLVTIRHFPVIEKFFEEDLFKKGGKFKYKSIFTYSFVEFLKEFIRQKYN